MKILLILHSPTWNLFFFYYEPYPKVVTCTHITNHQVTLSSKEVLHQMNPFLVKGVNISAKLSSMWIFLQQNLTIFYYFMYRLIFCVSIWFFFFWETTSSSIVVFHWLASLNLQASWYEQGFHHSICKHNMSHIYSTLILGL